MQVLLCLEAAEGERGPGTWGGRAPAASGRSQAGTGAEGGSENGDLAIEPEDTNAPRHVRGAMPISVGVILSGFGVP